MDAFEILTQNISPNLEKCSKLISYFKSTWMGEKTYWSPTNWCWFRQYVRTNNDVEGYHNKLNKRAEKTSLPIYQLIELLGKETNNVVHDAQKVTKGDLMR